MKIRLLNLLFVLFSLACVGSALAVPTPSTTPVPSPTVEVLEIVSSLDKYRVTSHALEVRAAPGEQSINIGYLLRGAIVNVYETQETPDEACQVWARIQVDSWVCMDRLEKVQ